jgi:hypothetical protein
MYAAVWFGPVLENQSEIRSDPAVFSKGYPNTSTNIRFFAVFDFFWIDLQFLFGLVWI